LKGFLRRDQDARISWKKFSTLLRSMSDCCDNSLAEDSSRVAV
jgi:hypothetical protein